MFSTIADTVLMLDAEKWIRGLPPHDGALADQHTMKLSPAYGVSITFDRYIMTADGFIPRKDLGQYKMQKKMELFKALSEQGRLFVARAE